MTPAGDTARITPACAGNTPVIAPGKRGLKDHPRLRGEYRVTGSTSAAGVGSPPLARGILLLRDPGKVIPGITPACAGNTGGQGHGPPAKGDHPRLRGEYPLIYKCILLARGSPPLARGIRENVNGELTESRITPACAGNTAVHRHRDQAAVDHPRLRGEYHRPILDRRGRGGSPPLARGIHLESP